MKDGEHAIISSFIILFKSIFIELKKSTFQSSSAKYIYNINIYYLYPEENSK